MQNSSSAASDYEKSNQALELWILRAQAQRDLLQAVTAESRTPRAETLNVIRESLVAFGKRQIDFFYTGYRPKTNNDENVVRLDVSDLLPVNYVFDTTLQQIAYDTAVIVRAIDGRRNRGKDIKSQETLGRADLVAHEALEPAFEAGLIRAPAVMTYFQKSPDIRVVPYVPVALVGVPESAADVRRDLLATPHEVGHYVFNHGRYDRRAIIEFARFLVEKQPDWLKRWLEEIFADVYGTIVAGPVMALDFQDLLDTHSQERFLEDDGDHPIEAARLAIYFKVLEELGYPGDLIDALRTRWEKIKRDRKVPKRFTPFGMQTTRSYKEAERRLAAVAVAMLRTVFSGLVAGYKRERFGYQESRAESYAQNLDKLYEDFEAFARGLTEEVAPVGAGASQQGRGRGRKKKRLRGLRKKKDASMKKELVEVVEFAANDAGGFEPVSTDNQRPIGTTGTWLDLITDSNALESDLFVTSAVWREVLLANGWATQGPNEKWP